MAESNRKRSPALAIVHVVLWIGVVIAAAYGGWLGFTGVYLANGAPQEAAAAGMALAIAVIPYVIARAWDEITDFS